MYNAESIQRLAVFIAARDGINDKSALAAQVQSEFGLTKDRSVFSCKDFAIRFCKSKSRSFSNTVLALSVLQKYDFLPFVVCLVAPNKNYLLLANSSFLRKISHSSQELRIDNIRGSFNGSDILRDFEGTENEPSNFEYLFSSHENNTFQENLERLVEATNNIRPTGTRFTPTADQESCIVRSIDRARAFLQSDDYSVLFEDLQSRVSAVSSEIAIAAFIENVNLRGRIIEYLVTAAGDLHDVLIDALHEKKPLPEIYTADNLGDYSRSFAEFDTATDIKTKIMFLSSNPKGYNIDKLLSFLACEKSVYLIYIIAINENKHISTCLCSMYNKQILNGTRIIKQWAGRSSRGVTQYDGRALENAVSHFDCTIDSESAEAFIKKCLNT